MPNIEVSNTTRMRIPLDAVRDYSLLILEAMHCQPATEMTVSLVGDRRMQDLNEQWRGIGTPTDVLSFPALEGDLIPGIPCDELGDVVIAPRQALSDAAEDGMSFDEKMKELLRHGILHLLGYDHIELTDAEKMKNAESGLLKSISEKSTAIIITYV